jgi:hypothetical protein
LSQKNVKMVYIFHLFSHWKNRWKKIQVFHQFFSLKNSNCSTSGWHPI